jgi:superoxide dismutase, Cu-Zn family
VTTIRTILMTGAAAVIAVSLGAANAADMAHAVMKDKQGKEVGHVELTATKEGVRLRVSLKGMPAGERAFHIHETGKCEAPSFKSAGGHFNPDKERHGGSGVSQPRAGTVGLTTQGHAGDMPNLKIPQNGQLTLEIMNAEITLENGKPNSVFQPGGTAIVIHQGGDDYKTDPDGAAGERIACGVIEPGGSSAVAPPKR